MEELKSMKKQLMAAAQSQMGNLENVNANELGEVIDMIKDLEEAIYYCSIVKAMDDSKEEKEDNKKYDEIMTSLLAREEKTEPAQRYYTQPYYPMWDDPREMSPYMRRGDSRVQYYDGGNGGQGSSNGMRGTMSGGSRAYSEPMNRQYMRDPREGRSGQYRRGYMESKEQHQGTEKQVQELEDYMEELSGDITEMIRGASAEEKSLLNQKLSLLASKVLNA